MRYEIAAVPGPQLAPRRQVEMYLPRRPGFALEHAEMPHHACETVDHGFGVVARGLRSEVGTAHFGVHRRNPAAVEVMRGRARELVLVHERRAKCARER